MSRVHRDGEVHNTCTLGDRERTRKGSATPEDGAHARLNPRVEVGGLLGRGQSQVVGVRVGHLVADGPPQWRGASQHMQPPAGTCHPNPLRDN